MAERLLPIPVVHGLNAVIGNFLYTEHCMEIFGHAPSTEMSTFKDLFDFYLENRDKHEILIVSDEIGKSKPATLFFLSKFGCQIEKVKFYSGGPSSLKTSPISAITNKDILKL